MSKMNFGLLTVLCLCFAVPMATGLTCYSCTDTTLLNTGSSCLDSPESTVTCTSPSSGLVAKCYKSAGEITLVSVTSNYVLRGCTYVASTVSDSCTSADSGLYSALGSFDGMECYCSTDNCNGQTTLAPPIITSLVGLSMALWAVL